MRAYLVFLAVLATTPVLAADPDLPAPAGPGEWRYITEDDDTTTSRCIGRPDTPLCAAETLLACFQRGHFDLCRMVDSGAEQYASVFASPTPRGQYLAYRVIESHAFAPGDPPGEDAAAQAGDVLLVIDQREGALGRAAPPTGAPLQRFLLRRADGGFWDVANWGGPGD